MSSTTVDLSDVNDFRFFTSPNWTSNYPDNAYQRFTIFSPVGSIIKLDVLYLELEGACYDPVIIYDGEQL